MRLQEIMGHVITMILILGLFMVGIGITLWIFEKFQDFYINWQIRLAVLGLILLIFGGIAMKLFQEMR